MNARGSAEIAIVIALVAVAFATLGMLLGDQLRNHVARAQSAIRGQRFEGYAPSHVTRARTRARGLNDFNDARIREDQYNRKNEPMRSRKGTSNHKGDLFDENDQ